jgi:hypothetical protein
MAQIEGNERKGEEGNGHNDAHYCDSRLATPVRRGRLLLEGPATVGKSSARTCGNSSTRIILLGRTKGAGEVRCSQWPRFTPDERQEYFTFSPPELTALEQFHSHPSCLYAMLQLGYFKARQHDRGTFSHVFFPSLHDCRKIPT